MRSSHILLVILVAALAWWHVNAIPTSELEQSSEQPTPAEGEQTDEENVQPEAEHNERSVVTEPPEIVKAIHKSELEQSSERPIPAEGEQTDEENVEPEAEPNEQPVVSELPEAATEVVVGSSVEIRDEASQFSASKEVTEPAMPQSDSVEIGGQEEVTNGPEVAVVQNDEIRTHEPMEHHETNYTERISAASHPIPEQSEHMRPKVSDEEDLMNMRFEGNKKQQEAQRLLYRLVDILDAPSGPYDKYEYILALKSPSGSVFIPQNPREGNRKHLATLLGFVEDIIEPINGFRQIDNESYGMQKRFSVTELSQNSSEHGEEEHHGDGLAFTENREDLADARPTESQSETSASEMLPSVTDESSETVHNQPHFEEEQHESTEHEEQDQTEAHIEPTAHEEGCTDESHSHHPADEGTEDSTELTQ